MLAAAPLRCPRRGRDSRLGAALRRSCPSLPTSLCRQALARAGRGRERFRAPLASLPCRREQAHAEHLLRRAQVIDAAGDRPPAVAGSLEKREAPQPFLLRERRHVAIEAAADDVEAEQRKPVLQSIERNEIT